MDNLNVSIEQGKDRGMSTLTGFAWTVWLPRQDQLQDMVLEKDVYLTGVFYDLYEFSGEYLYGDDGDTVILHSFEQLWLAYVMRKKYGKVWGGKKWVAEA
jgi:hypothetical protein